MWSCIRDWPGLCFFILFCCFLFVTVVCFLVDWGGGVINFPLSPPPPEECNHHNSFLSYTGSKMASFRKNRQYNSQYKATIYADVLLIKPYLMLLNQLNLFTLFFTERLWLYNSWALIGNKTVTFPPELASFEVLNFLQTTNAQASQSFMNEPSQNLSFIVVQDANEIKKLPCLPVLSLCWWQVWADEVGLYFSSKHTVLSIIVDQTYCPGIILPFFNARLKCQITMWSTLLNGLISCFLLCLEAGIQCIRAHSILEFRTKKAEGDNNNKKLRLNWGILES